MASASISNAVPSDPSSTTTHPKIIIVGSGPSGLLLSLLLRRLSPSSFPPSSILLLEAWPHLDSRLRATQYGVPATRVFKRAGVLDDLRKISLDAFPSICWRRTRDGVRLTGIDLSCVMGEEERMVVCPLARILEVLLEKVKDEGVDIRFSQKVTDVGQDDDRAWVDVEVQVRDGLDGRDEKVENRRYYADYVVGADGSKSIVRKCLYGSEWPGMTHDAHLMVQNVFYDGFEKHNWDGGNYLVDQEHWGLLAKRRADGLWRVTYGDDDGYTDEEYEKRREWKFEHLLPGRPKPGEYEVGQTDHFRMHNRCVKKMRVGRVFLTGDAAHLCNPFGGYGAMTAILDVGGLADCFIGLYEGKAGEEILDLYSEIRRTKFLDYVDARSMKNMNRICKSDPMSVLEEDKFLQILTKLEGNSEETKEFLLKTSSIEYDFTQHYRR